MSIASAITAAQGKVAAAYTACNNKGATMPAAGSQNLSNLATTIGTIPTGGGSSNLTTLSVTPTTSAQQLTPTAPVDGWNEVDVAAVTSAIDSNIVAGNIKKDVVILGVTGTYEGSGGGGGLVEKDVNFRDYDGTLIASYTAAEFANVTALPANPSHSGLTAKGWNWSLNGAKTFVATYGGLEIGQMYVTDDGKTRLYIETVKDGDAIVVRYNQTAANGVVIDWGDGSATTTQSGTGAKQPSHTYTTKGQYLVTLTCSSGTFTLGNNQTASVLNNSYNNFSFLKKVELGSGVTSLGVGCFYDCGCLTSVSMNTLNGKIDTNCFYRCVGLKYLVIPTGVTETTSTAFGLSSLYTMSIAEDLPNIWSNGFKDISVLHHLWLPSVLTGIGNSGSTFANCFSLERINYPPLITQYGNSAFSHCHVLKEITLPSTITTIKDSMFRYCYSLREITIPASVTTINANAFADCYALNTVYCLRTTPPTLSATSAFHAAVRFIYVPASAVSAYQGASNWSSFSSKIVAIPE